MTYIQQNKNTLVGSKNPFDSLESWGEKGKGKEDYIKEFSTIAGVPAEKLLDSLSTLFPKFAAKVHFSYECKSDDDLRREKRLAHIDKYDLYTRKTKRYKTIKVKWQNRQMQTRIKTYTGWTAEIIQHEIDHCNGILI